MWDAFKAFTRGAYVSAIKAAWVEKNSKSDELQARETQCDKAHAETPSTSSLTELQMARRALLVHFQNLIQCNCRNKAEELFEKGDKNGKLLAYLTAETQTHAAIPCVYSLEGNIVSDREGIMQAFVAYYADLYSAIPPYDQQVLTDLLGPLQIPVLPDEVVASL